MIKTTEDKKGAEIEPRTSVIKEDCILKSY